MAFDDQRGSEGDHGDPYRVGGIYNSGIRTAKVLSNEPWAPRLLAALVAEFRAAGVDAAGLERLPVDRPLDLPWLEGAIRSFSTELRFLLPAPGSMREAHVSAMVRLRSAGGLILVEKEVQTRTSGLRMSGPYEVVLQRMLNEAFADFVRRVARDPEILAALQ